MNVDDDSVQTPNGHFFLLSVLIIYVYQKKPNNMYNCIRYTPSNNNFKNKNELWYFLVSFNLQRSHLWLVVVVVVVEVTHKNDNLF